MDVMIEVKDLTKWYGQTLAVDHVSFTIRKGQIVGFLGPKTCSPIRWRFAGAWDTCRNPCRCTRRCECGSI